MSLEFLDRFRHLVERAAVRLDQHGEPGLLVAREGMSALPMM